MKGFVIVLLVIAAVLVPATTVFATHYWSGWKFFTTNAEYCISPAYTSVLKNGIRLAAAHINALPTKFTLTEEAYGSNCNSRVFPYNFNPNYLAITSIYRSGPTTISHVDILTNTYYKWQEQVCSIPPGSTATSVTYSIRHTLLHEFGHMEGLKHPAAGSTESTVMQPVYSCSHWSSYKTHDSSTLNTIYGVALALPRFDKESLDRMTSLIVVGEVVAQGSGGTDKITSNVAIPQEKSVIKIAKLLQSNYDKDTVEVFTPRAIDDAIELKQNQCYRLMLFEWEGEYQISGLKQGVRELPSVQCAEPRDVPAAEPKMRDENEVDERREAMAKHSEMEDENKDEDWKKQLRDQLGIRDGNHNRTADDERRELLRIVT